MKDILNARKITIIGTPGSGKSHLAEILGTKLELPVFHMDKHFRVIINRGTLEDRIPIILERTKTETQKEKWIIDGNYPSHLESLRLRLGKADIVLYLNFDFDFCIESVRKRGISTETNALDTEESVEELVTLIKTKYPQANENIKKYIKQFANEKTIEFNNRKQVNDFIESLLNNQFGSGGRI